MKRSLLLLIVLIPITVLAQDVTVKEYAQICKAWGISKYFHPEKSQGFVDMDSLLLSNLEKLKTKEKSFSDVINDIIEYDSQINPKETHRADSLFIALNYPSQLLSVNQNSHIKHMLGNTFDSLYYIQYEYPVGNTSSLNELDLYNDTLSMDVRLLSIFRYWNLIFYFYPYKEIISQDWNDVLTVFITKMLNTESKMEYLLVMKELVCSIEDSHSFFYSDDFYLYYIKRQLPVLFAFINDTLIVKEDFKCVGFNSILSKGDRILSINDSSVDSLISEYYPIAKGSNEISRQTSLALFFRWSRADSIRIKYVSHKEVFDKYIHTVSLDKFADLYEKRRNYMDTTFFKYRNLVYWNPKYYAPNQIPALVNSFFDSEAILIDLRSYPEFSLYELLEYLPHDSVPFFVSVVPTKNKPGSFYKRPSINVKQREDSIYYGTVYCLVSGLSQSRSEFYVMAMQKTRNCKVIGTKTSGADGNVSYIDLPGGICTYYSGIGIEYPDGHVCQKNGINIDYYLEMSTSDWYKYKDPYLYRALDLIFTELVE